MPIQRRYFFDEYYRSRSCKKNRSNFRDANHIDDRLRVYKYRGIRHLDIGRQLSDSFLLNRVHCALSGQSDNAEIWDLAVKR